MKKLLLILLLSCWHIYALEVTSTLKIYHDLFASLLHKSHYMIYTDNRDLYRVFSKSTHITLVSNPNVADALVITKRSSLRDIASDSSKVILTTKYNLLRSSSKILGAFYWRKGRAQLLFVKQRLHRIGLTIPGKYSNYTVNDL